MFLNYVNSDDIFGQINVNRLIYRTSTLYLSYSGVEFQWSAFTII